MTSTQATPRARMRPRGDRQLLLSVAVGLVLAIVVFGIPAVLHGPDFVGHVTVINPTGMAVEIAVAKPGADDPVEIGSIAARSRETFEDVVDVGDRWNIRVVANGGAEVEATVSRIHLSDHDWTFTVSDPLESQLSRRGGITEPRDRTP